jgi:hypothetical protein
MNSDALQALTASLVRALDSDPQIKKLLAEYVAEKMHRAQIAAGVVDDITSLRREQGRVMACRDALRDLRLDAKANS